MPVIFLHALIKDDKKALWRTLTSALKSALPCITVQKLKKKRNKNDDPVYMCRGCPSCSVYDLNFKIGWVLVKVKRTLTGDGQVVYSNI